MHPFSTLLLHFVPRKLEGNALLTFWNGNVLLCRGTDQHPFSFSTLRCTGRKSAEKTKFQNFCHAEKVVFHGFPKNLTLCNHSQMWVIAVDLVCFLKVPQDFLIICVPDYFQGWKYKLISMFSIIVSNY